LHDIFILFASGQYDCTDVFFGHVLVPTSARIPVLQSEDTCSFGLKLLAFTVKISNTWDFFFIHMSALQTVAMATNNRKDNHFFAFFHLFASLSRVSLGKIS